MGNATVLASVSRNELIHTVQDRQLRFLGHMLRNTRSLYARAFGLYQPTHGMTWPSTKLRGLHREVDRNEDWWTQGGVTRL